jgi:hypothetical protein
LQLLSIPKQKSVNFHHKDDMHKETMLFQQAASEQAFAGKQNLSKLTENQENLPQRMV